MRIKNLLHSSFSLCVCVRCSTIRLNHNCNSYSTIHNYAITLCSNAMYTVCTMHIYMYIYALILSFVWCSMLSPTLIYSIFKFLGGEIFDEIMSWLIHSDFETSMSSRYSAKCVHSIESNRIPFKKCKHTNSIKNLTQWNSKIHTCTHWLHLGFIHSVKVSRPNHRK